MGMERRCHSHTMTIDQRGFTMLDNYVKNPESRHNWGEEAQE